MRYGILTTNFGDFGHVETLTELATIADKNGWDGFFLWDHIQFPGFEPAADPWMALAVIASKTKKISLGTFSDTSTTSENRETCERSAYPRPSLERASHLRSWAGFSDVTRISRFR